MKTQFGQLGTQLYKQFIQPHSADVDGRRREFILNALLSGLWFMAGLTLLDSLLSYFVFLPNDRHLGTLLAVIVFWVIISSLLVLSRRSKPVLAAYLFAALLLISGIYYTVAWGFGLAQAELMLALTIVIAGVLFSAPQALVASLVISLSLITITYLQVNHLLHPATYWRSEPFSAGDSVGYVAVFIIIGLVSWLSNREIDRSLQRAQHSESALQKERDNLEAKVIARTRELEDLQLARLLEMQPFAEFGRIGASLVHEIANPLTAATLQLEALDKEQHSDLVHQVQRNLRQLERYLMAARKQLKRESRLTTFSVGAELKQVVSFASNRARKANVEIVLENKTRAKLYGDVVKFNQLVANLLANAIDASNNEAVQKATVHLEVVEKDGFVCITVSDNGSGITRHGLEHLFEPFYSTKKSLRSGLGIGLTMVKQFVEHDFGGTVAVESTPKQGTVFTVRLRSQGRA